MDEYRSNLTTGRSDSPGASGGRAGDGGEGGDGGGASAADGEDAAHIEAARKPIRVPAGGSVRVPMCLLHGVYALSVQVRPAGSGSYGWSNQMMVSLPLLEEGAEVVEISLARLTNLRPVQSEG